MKTVRAALLVSLMASSIVVVASTQAFACRCIPPRPDATAIKDADAVFTGTMVKADVAEAGFTPGWWTFDVDAVYKGDVGEMQEVKSHTQSTACGLIFKEEKRYVVFAHLQRGELHTNSCENTRPIGDDEVLAAEAFGGPESTKKTQAAPPLVEDEEQPSPNLTPLVVGGASVLLVAGLAALALRRKRTGG